MEYRDCGPFPFPEKHQYHNLLGGGHNDGNWGARGGRGTWTHRHLEEGPHHQQQGCLPHPFAFLTLTSSSERVLLESEGIYFFVYMYVCIYKAKQGRCPAKYVVRSWAQLRSRNERTDGRTEEGEQASDGLSEFLSYARGCLKFKVNKR